MKNVICNVKVNEIDIDVQISSRVFEQYLEGPAFRGSPLLLHNPNFTGLSITACCFVRLTINLCANVKE